MPEGTPRIQPPTPVSVTAIITSVEIAHNLKTHAMILDRPFDVIVRPTFPGRVDRINVFVALDGWRESGSVYLMLFAPEPLKRIVGRGEIQINAQPDGFAQVYIGLPEVTFPVPGNYQLVLFGPDRKVLGTKRLLLEAGDARNAPPC